MRRWRSKTGLAAAAAAGLLLLAGCHRAERYGGIPRSEAPLRIPDHQPRPAKLEFDIWRPAKESLDIPIVFVPSTSADWKNFPDDPKNARGTYWYWYPRPVTATAPEFRPAFLPARAMGSLSPGLGSLSPLLPAFGVVSVFREPIQIKIKVPLGLPDPTSYIPPDNPPTLAKWKLGQELFFEKSVPVAANEAMLSCSRCHQPEEGYTEKLALPQHMKHNAPSLINCVYNRRQFWDGRVETLEETIVDLRTATEEDAGKQHNFPGFINAVKQNNHYRQRFKEVFGIDEPTADAVAKCLATYMRTILSGNSVFDRAEAARAEAQRKKQPGSDQLTESHFRAVEASSPAALERGYRLFTGEARCAVCHPLNGLFTDRDFHNIGLDRDAERYHSKGKDEGRIVHVPPGLKDPRLWGAYRTPTLRALPRTAPYMHDGRLASLGDVVAHFNVGVQAELNAFVAAALLESPGVARQLKLSKADADALVLFLQALDGDPVDPVITRGPK